MQRASFHRVAQPLALTFVPPHLVFHDVPGALREVNRNVHLGLRTQSSLFLGTLGSYEPLRSRPPIIMRKLFQSRFDNLSLAQRYAIQYLFLLL